MKYGKEHGNTKHGKIHDRVYSIWEAMKTRCLNKNAPNYKNYGGRGIKVCDRWLKFQNFYDDMGDPPDGLTLERKDNNKSYQKSNCEWSSFSVQLNNKRNNVIVVYRNQEMTASQFATKVGIRRNYLYKKLRAGFTAIECVKMFKNRIIKG